MKRATTALLAMLLALICRCDSDRDETRLQEAISSFEQLAQRADRVTLYAISCEADPDYSSFQSNPRVADYPIRHRYPLSRTSAAPLVKAVTTRARHVLADGERPCRFIPHHVLELASGSNTMRAVICIKCGDIEFLDHDDRLARKTVSAKANVTIAKELHILTGH